MSQRNDRILKRKILFDGVEIPGLVECSDLKDESGSAEVPGFGRTVEVKTGVSKFAPLDLVYKDDPGTVTRKFFEKYYYPTDNPQEPYYDVVVVNCDATGSEINRWLLRDTECKSFSQRAYNAGGVVFAGIAVTLLCTSTPVPLDPQ